MVVALAFGGIAGEGDNVGPIERIIKAAPAGIGGVQREAGIHHRHNKLRPGNGRYLAINVQRGDGEVFTFRNQIADICEEGLVSDKINGAGFVMAVPCVDLALHFIAFFKQRLVNWRQIGERAFKPGPKIARGYACTREDFIFNQIGKFTRNLKAAYGLSVGHSVTLKAINPASACIVWEFDKLQGVWRQTGFSLDWWRFWYGWGDLDCDFSALNGYFQFEWEWKNTFGGLERNMIRSY